MKQIVIWIDDMRNPFEESWSSIIKNNMTGEYTTVWLKDYTEFKIWLRVSVEDPAVLFPTMVCFDHDLGKKKTGLDCAKLLVDTCMYYNLPLPKFECHSTNPAGRDNIMSYLNSYLRSLL